MRGANNDVARQMTTVLLARVTYLRTTTTRSASPTRRQGTVETLPYIVKALKNRDADKAEQIVRAYVERSAAFAYGILLDLRTTQGEA
jgi:GntR family transcriptional regulator, trigonelline degradation regulator